MAIGCGPKIAKFILVAFNILFWLSGLILIIIGSVYLANGTMKYVDDIINANTNRNILIGFLVIGIIIFVIGFCGCCGAMKESRFLLAAYIIMLLFIIVAEVAFGIFAIVKRQPVENAITSELTKAIQTSYGGNDNTVTKSVDGIQQGIECCGVQSSEDWRKTNWYVNGTKSQPVPQSCCTPPKSVCWQPLPGNGTVTGTVFPDGCIPKIQKYVRKYFPAVIGVALGIAFFEIFVVICAFCLCRNTDSHSQAV